MSINKAGRSGHARSIAVIFIAALSGAVIFIGARETQTRSGATGQLVDLVEERGERGNAPGEISAPTGVTQQKSALGHPCPNKQGDKCVGLEQPRWPFGALDLPWRVLAGDRDGDGDYELIASFGGDFAAQRILGIHGYMKSRGFVAGVHWCSEGHDFVSRLHLADLHGGTGVEVLASTYHGSRKAPNSDARGSGIFLYRAPEPPVDATPLGKTWSVPKETLIPCAQINDFQLADFDADGDLDIVVAVINISGPGLCSDKVSKSIIHPDFRTVLDEVRPSLLYEKSLLKGQADVKDHVHEVVESGLKIGSGLDRSSQNFYISSVDRAATHTAILAAAPTLTSTSSSPYSLTSTGPVIAYYENRGNATIPDFGNSPTWHTDKAQLGGHKPSKIEVFDVDQDGYLDVVVGVEEVATIALLGARGGPRPPIGVNFADPETFKGRALSLGSGDDLTAMDMSIAKLPMKDGTAAVFIVEARSCHKVSAPCKARAHARIRRVGAESVARVDPSGDNDYVLSVELTEGPQGEPLLLVGRGKPVGKNTMEGLPIDAFDVQTGEPAPYTLLDSSHAALDLAVLAGYDGGVAGTATAVLKGNAITLSGIGPMRIDAVTADGVGLQECRAELSERCYWRVGGATVLVRGVQEGALVSVGYTPPSRRDIAVADARLAQKPIIAWDRRRSE